MDGFIKVANVSEIPDGEMRGRKVNNTPVLLVNIGGALRFCIYKGCRDDDQYTKHTFH